MTIINDVELSAISFLTKIFIKFLLRKKKVKIDAFVSYEVKNNGIGSRLASFIRISNKGKIPVYIDALLTYDKKKEVYYPSFSIEPGFKLEPQQSVIGSIPADHLLNPDPVYRLVIIDGVGDSYKFPRKKLKNHLKILNKEYERLKNINLT